MMKKKISRKYPHSQTHSKEGVGVEKTTPTKDTQTNHLPCGQCRYFLEQHSICFVIDVFIDEFEADAVPKSKETETQPEPEDGGEESREEGNIACETLIT